MYEDGKGTRLTCYYLSIDVPGETEFKYREENGVSAFYWIDDGLGYAIAADAPATCCSKRRRSFISRIPPNPNPRRRPASPAKPWSFSSHVQCAGRLPLDHRFAE